VVAAGWRAEAQIRQIRAALAEDPSVRARAFIVSPVSEMALMPLVHDAARLRIAWVFLSRWSDTISELREQYAEVPIFAVLPDHEEIGRIQGQQLCRLLRPGDELVQIRGPAGTYSTRGRLAGLKRELEGLEGFRWSHFNSDWSQVGGETAMKSWLSAFATGTLPSFVIAGQNDSMALGARRAVLEWVERGGQLPDGNLRVVGCDGSPSFGQRLVSSGELLATVVIPPVSGRAVDEVVAALRFGKQPAARTTVGVRSHPDVASLTADVKWRR
jgi:ribose transport system substrate-binding protein